MPLPATVRPILLLSALAALPTLPVAAGAAAFEPTRHWGRDRSVDIEHLALDVSIDCEAGTVEGAAELSISAFAGGTEEIVLDALELEVERILLDGSPVQHVNDGERLTVELPSRIEEGERHGLRVEYRAEPRTGLHFVRPSRDQPDVQLQCWSQGEDRENSAWFPVHDHPNERMTSETRVTVARPLQVVGNGVLLGVTENDDGTSTWHHRMDVPHVAYLVSVAIGDWAVTRETWQGVELTYHVPKARAGDAHRTFKHTARMLELVSDRTGVHYPYPVYRQVAVSNFMFGGMENIAATTLNDNTLHDERSHLDWTSDGLVAHEIAHQWFGDLVTCEDWSDIWLNEGFATYFGTMAEADVHGPDHWTDEIEKLRASAVKADSGRDRRPVVTNEYVEPMDIFDGHAYAKGAMVLHSLRRELGDAAFFAAIRRYLDDNAGRSVDTADFVDAVEAETGRDVSRFAAQWLFGAGQPELAVSWSSEDGMVAVSVEQSQEPDELVGLFDVPLDIFVLGERSDGESYSQAEEVRSSAKKETWHFEVPGRVRAVLVDPEGWLLRELEIDRPAREVLWVLRESGLLLPRMEAVRELADHVGRGDAVDALLAVLGDDAEPWQLRREAAKALGEARSAAAREGLLAALETEEEARVRAAIPESLGSFEHRHVVRALRELLRGDRSYAVRASAATALARADEEHSAGVLVRALRQPSDRAVIFRAALSALAEVDRDRAERQARHWLEPPHEPRARTHAMSVLAGLASDWSEAERRDEVEELLVELTRDPHVRVRLAALEGLATLGEVSALDHLRGIAETAPLQRVRREARDATAKLERTAAEGAASGELAKQLRSEREKREEMEGELRELKGRVDELVERKGGE